MAQLHMEYSQADNFDLIPLKAAIKDSYSHAKHKYSMEHVLHASIEYSQPSIGKSGQGLVRVQELVQKKMELAMSEEAQLRLIERFHKRQAPRSPPHLSCARWPSIWRSGGSDYKAVDGETK